MILKSRWFWGIGAVLSLVGCQDESQMLDLTNQLSTVNNTVAKLSADVKREQVSERTKLAKSIAENARFATVAAYYLATTGLSFEDEEAQQKLSFILREMTAEMTMMSMYASLKSNGYNNSVVPMSFPKNSSSTGYLVRGEWEVVVPKGSDIAYNYPYKAFEMVQFEKLAYTNDVCNQGFEPIAIHALMNRRGNESPLPTVSIIDENNAWRVSIDEPNVFKAFRDYKVLVEVRCREIQDAT